MPAVIYATGYKAWYTFGLYHRDGDMPAVEYGDDYKAWYTYGKLHREIGPAGVYCNNLVRFYEHGV